MILASAASAAPRREVSSQGCTIRVGTAAIAGARAISRSYLLSGSRTTDPGAAMTLRAPVSACMIFPRIGIVRTASGVSTFVSWWLFLGKRDGDSGACLLRWRIQFEKTRDTRQPSLIFSAEITARAQDVLEQFEGATAPPSHPATTREARRARLPHRGAACRTARARES